MGVLQERRADNERQETRLTTDVPTKGILYLTKRNVKYD